MRTVDQARTGLTMALRHEPCDKCATRMWLHAARYGFERWRSPHCLQVVGIDRDPQVGGRYQLHRGQPWRYAPDYFNA